MDSDDDICTPPDILELATKVTHNLLPEKSRKLYEKEYNNFLAWKIEKKTTSFSENVILAYLKYLSDKFKPSSMWAKYSMLKSTLSVYNNIDITKYSKVIAFLKRSSEGHKEKKSLTFTSGQIKMFLEDSPDILYLFEKELRLHGLWAGRNGDPGDGADEVEEQVVYLPALVPREAHSAADSTVHYDDVPVPYSFEAFGRSFDLQLVPNRRLVSPQFRVWSERGQELPLSAVDVSCHYLHTGRDAVAAFSAYKDHALLGLMVVDNSTYEVRPLSVASGLGRAEGAGSVAGGRAHVVRRAPPPPALVDDARLLRPRPRRPRTIHKPPPASYTIEIALFLDEAGYKTFYPFFNYNEADLRDMLLAYINGVQALYQHASLGTQIQLSLVRLTLLRSQPNTLPVHAERSLLLDAFCRYQQALNVEDDDDPQHWDMALLLSGLDFYADEGGVRNGVTMGLAPVGGVCLPAHACVVAEFGTYDEFSRPYPSAGFTSVYILAHEIGHNLGMHHDGTGNSCPRDGYIMSPSRGTSGETSWSPCSASVVANLSWASCLFDGGDTLDAPPELLHESFGSAPGTLWTAKKQCELLLRDHEASAASAPAAAGSAAVCEQLACRSPHRAGLYYSGPALPGTVCGHHMWCQGGECVPSPEMSVMSTTPRSSSTTERALSSVGTGLGPGAGEWSAWREGACVSGCAARARGARERTRHCLANDVTSCRGIATEVVLCDDIKVCGKKKRVSPNELASRRCSEFASKLQQLDARGGGLQAPHDPSRMWMGCAVFCQRRGGGGYYAPRAELLDAGLDPYLPDGSWCHHDGLQDYYCLKHHCLPESFKMTPQWQVSEIPTGEMGSTNSTRARDTTPGGAEGAAELRTEASLRSALAIMLRRRSDLLHTYK